MLTAKEIAEQTGIEDFTVRYRLANLRRGEAIRFKVVGKTYLYYAGAVNKVLSFGRKK
jgi:predicted transcriptional regulator